jgi:ATPase subunit of ABC transporter with duplicated ATPase domains
MIADITVTEKSFGPKSLMSDVRFSVDDGEKIGIIGRNGIGKSTLFGILAGTDKDFSGDIIYRQGTVVVATQQEYHGIPNDLTALQYVLAGLPEYTELSHIIETYPATMGDHMGKINRYTEALQRFDDKGFYQIEEQIEREFEALQLTGIAHRPFAALSGGQKRLVDIVKVMHADADLVLVDEPTNHMDYIAKAQFTDWLRGAREAVLVITHDRDVLREVDRIVELKDGGAQSFRGNYDAYLKQNAMMTSTQMNDFEMIERRIANLKDKVLNYQRLKEKSRSQSTIQRFKRLEETARRELAELQEREKPTFWIDKDSVADLHYKTAAQYEKFKARNVRIGLKGGAQRSQHVLVTARNLSLGYTASLFEGVAIDLRAGEALELRGRNGAGKTTLIKALLGDPSVTRFAGELTLDPTVRYGIYEQEISPQYFGLSLEAAIERMYLDRDLPITGTKIRSLMHDYLFEDTDGAVLLEQLSGGQKARFQLIAMLANDPQLLILDEPTNHLDLPSIEELEAALTRYSGAIIYVSHDSYFRCKIESSVIELGA